MQQTSAYRRALTFAGTDYSLAVNIASGIAFSILLWFFLHDRFPFPPEIAARFHFVQSINETVAWMQAHFQHYTRAVSNVVGAFLESVELFLWFKPWPIILVAFVMAALAYGGLRLALFTAFGVLFWGMMKMWDPAMSTLALMGVSVGISILLGLLTGIACSQNNTVESIIRPVLDTMQVMPSFVYLVPAIIFFGIGGPSAAMAIIIYAMPPVVRLTNLGIRQVPATTIEAAQSYGTTRWQMLFKVQLPQALPSIMLGINQTIMMGLGLAVLATFVGAEGLGAEVWKALRKLNIGWSLEGGLCIVFMAIIFDRLSTAMARPAASGLLVDPSQMTFRLLPQQWLYWRPARFVEGIIGLVWDFCAFIGQGIVDRLAAIIGRLLGRGFGGWLRAHPFFVVSLLMMAAILGWDAFVSPIGSFPRAWHFTLRGPMDDAVDWLVVNPAFISFTKGVRAVIYLYILNPLDKFITGLPWWFVLLGFFWVVWRSVSLRFALVTVAALLFTGAAGLWDIAMYTLASTVASIILCLLIGLPVGIWAAHNRIVKAILMPILDTMQTMPAFVYLIPVLMFFGGNPVTAVIATVIYALPPLVRMTILGLQQLPPEINEVSGMFGSTTWQTLIKVKLPMASPSVMLGVNQAVVMALAMQTITPLVAGLGLGKEVYHAMNTADTGRGLVAGIGIVLLAIVLDRLTQGWTRNQRRALGL